MPKTVTAQQIIMQAQRRANEGDIDSALDLLFKIVNQNERHTQAWWEISKIIPKFEDELTALENVLALNPDHKQAKQRIADLKSEPFTKPLMQGIRYEERHALALADNVYLKIELDSVWPTIRQEAILRRQLIRLRQERPQLQMQHGTATITRLAAGTTLIFGCWILIDAGLNPLYVPFWQWFLLPLVALASWLFVWPTLSPRHPKWVFYFPNLGGTLEKQARLALKFCTGAIVLAAFAAVLLNV